MAKSLFRNIKPYEPSIPERNKTIVADTDICEQRVASSHAVQGMKLQNVDNYEEDQEKNIGMSSSACDSTDYVDIDTYKVVDIPERPFWSNDLAYPRRTAENQKWQPMQLANGKWSCRHKCKNKKLCKHLCCHEGLDQPPKRPRDSTSQKVSERQQADTSVGELTENHENTAIWPSQPAKDAGATMGAIEEVDLTREQSAVSYHDITYEDTHISPQCLDEMPFSSQM